MNKAFGVLTHHALNELYTSEDGCCTKCCAPCAALKELDEQGILEEVVHLWEFHDDGTPTLIDDGAWWKNGKVDRSWMYHQWSIGEVACSHSGVQ